MSGSRADEAHEPMAETPATVHAGPWPGAQEPAPPRKRKRFREGFFHMLGRDDPPEIVAASFALGVAISFTPLFGFHFLIALLLAFVLRLNKLDVLLGTLVINPITFPAVVAVAIPLGRFLLRARREALRSLPWRDLFTHSFWLQAGPPMQRVVLQGAVGMFVLSFLAGWLTYVLLVRLLRSRRLKNGTTAYLLP